MGIVRVIELRPKKPRAIEVEAPEDLSAAQAQGSGRARAYFLGAQAAAENKARSACPYAEGRGSGSFRIAWLRGYDAIKDADKAAAE